MKRMKWSRIMALCLAAVCLAGTVSALSFDLNKDGRTDVWDLQLAVSGGKADAIALEEALGGKDELHPNAEGVYEIYSALGLYNMAEHAKEGLTFELKADIDLGGIPWAPVSDFKGNFHGNGHTVSNVTINCSVGGDTGFFARVDRYAVDGKTVQSVIKDLNLENVVITEMASKDARFIGLLAGSNRGIVQNCTTTGVVTDNRMETAEKVYVGTVVGRNNNHDTIPGAVLSGTNTLTATAGSSNSADKVTGLTSKMAMFFADGTKVEYKIGIAGYSKAAITDMFWQDTTGSIDYKSETEQERRQGVVDHMYKQGTVEWTASEEFTYTSSNNPTGTHSTIYIPGRTYVGIPYNGSGCSYEHFTAQMQSEKDAQGRYVTVLGLEDGTNEKTGFAAVMGNDCSSAVGWAWASVLPSRVSNYGVRVNSTPYMVPNAYNAANYGALPAGGYNMIPINTDNGVDGRDTRTIIELNGGAAGMAEYYAKSSRGDALLFVEYTQNAEGTWTKGGGHARMLAYDPVIIRGGDGTIDLNKSYVITHEQGDGLFDNRLENGRYETYKGYNIKQTSWRTDHKYTLSVLLTEEGFKAEKNSGDYTRHPGCGYGYVPVTVAGFSYEGELREPYYNAGYTSQDNYHPVIQPNSGWYYSNYMIVRATMVIKDAEGNELYNKTAYMPNNNRGKIYQTLKLDELFADADDDLVNGQTYYETLQVLASNGQTVTVWNNKAFTYPSTEIIK